MRMDVHYVYLIAHRTGADFVGPIKVGFTKHPEKRLSALQTGNPTSLGTVFKFKAPSRDLAVMAESVFHDVAKEHRLSGEWFDMAPEFGLNTLTKCFMALIANDLSDPDEIRLLLDWCGVVSAASLWSSMQEDA